MRKKIYESICGAYLGKGDWTLVWREVERLIVSYCYTEVAI